MSGDVMFMAVHPIIDGLACVGPGHPKSMLEEDVPGQGTWWWESDL